jgi:hypothetical protein
MKKTHVFMYLIIILIVILALRQKVNLSDTKQSEETNKLLISTYVLNTTNIFKLHNNTKPNIWLYIPHDKNARKWENFGSRTSYDLNQPYINLTILSIIKKCNKDFNITIIDDTSIDLLLPNWKIDLNLISGNLKDNARKLAMAQIIYLYGGINVPISFLCMKNLSQIFNLNNNFDILNTNAGDSNKLIMCEKIDNTVVATQEIVNTGPMLDVTFYGAKPTNPQLLEYINLLQLQISHMNQTIGAFNNDEYKWLNANMKNGKIQVIPLAMIGVTDKNDKKLSVDRLLSQTHITFNPEYVGIYIPMNDILKYSKYSWFSRMSETQVLESNTIIGKYLLLTNSD